jgi:hypothetical protein
LPAGLSLAANGLLTGTVTGIESETTYSFTIEAIDAENQDSPRSFSITITVGDPYFYLTTLLLNGDGTNGANNNTFVDSSNNNFAITRNGNVAQGTFSPFAAPDGRWSAYFDGTGDYLGAPSNAAFEFGTGDFTIEAWIMRTGGSGNQPICQSDAVGTSSNNKWWFAVAGGGLFLGTHSAGGFSVVTATSFNTGVWYHVAVSRSSGTMYMFVNGVSTAFTTTGTPSGYNLSQNGLSIGAMSTPSYWTGYISNLRIVKGSALYTSNFTPSTTSLTNIANTSLLTCQSNRFKDNSTNNFAITRNGDVKVTSFSPFAPTGSYSAATNGGSGYFDGSGDYLTYATPDSVVREWWNTDWTIEAWIYPNTLTGLSYTDAGQKFPTMVGNASATTTNNFWSFGPSDNGLCKFYYYNGTPVHTAVTTAAIVVGQWNHVAMIRNSSGIKIFVNGVGTSYIAVSGTPQSGSTYPLIVGQINNTAINGYVSGLRIVRGSNVWTNDFTPPTSPPTAITNTSFLCNFTNGGIIDYTGKNNLETVGNAQISTSVKKYGTGSMYFDGTGDYLVAIGDSNNFALGSGNFTIEFWGYNLTGSAGNWGVFSVGATLSVDYAGITMSIGGGLFISTTGSNWTYTNVGSIVLSTNDNTWHHYAIVRNGSSLLTYKDGVQQASTSISGSIVNNSGFAVFGGKSDALGTLNGYIDDLRITKGIAQYTSNFTPPASAHRLR